MSTITQTAQYVASATASGREGRAVTSDGRLDVTLAAPRELGGSGDGTNPEQLFAAGYAACFASALGLVARKRRVEDFEEGGVERTFPARFLERLTLAARVEPQARYDAGADSWEAYELSRERALPDQPLGAVNGVLGTIVGVVLLVARNAAVLPLGSGAIAGSAYPISRVLLQGSLGFTSLSANSIDAVGDRDFVAEMLFSMAMLGAHLSRLSEDLILYGSSEFGFAKFGEAFTTGSSMMPQKRNPDALELARGSGARGGSARPSPAGRA